MKMTNLMVALLLVVSGQAFAGSATVLSMQTVKIAGIEVSVPKTQEADGTVCQSYVSNSEMTAKDGPGDFSKVSIAISKICDKPVQVSNGNGGYEIYPAKLISMRFVQTGDMGIHIVEVGK